MRLLFIAVLIAAAISATAQVVFIGRPPNPDWCLKAERIAPNLELSRTVRLRGRITDIAGAPLKNSPVALRRYVSETKQVPVETVKTDSDGNFEIAAVPKGQYRLLASPHRAFQQPEKLDCSDSGECDITIKLKVNPTDLPISTCPIR